MYCKRNSIYLLTYFIFAIVHLIFSAANIYILLISYNLLNVFIIITQFFCSLIIFKVNH